MARTIDAFADKGEAVIKTQGHWYDGNAARAQLRYGTLPPASEIWAFAEDQPPLAGPTGRFLVSVHTGDGFALDALRAACPRGVAIRHYDYDGRVVFVAFYGERGPDGG